MKRIWKVEKTQNEHVTKFLIKKFSNKFTSLKILRVIERRLNSDVVSLIGGVQRQGPESHRSFLKLVQVCKESRVLSVLVYDLILVYNSKTY